MSKPFPLSRSARAGCTCLAAFAIPVAAAATGTGEVGSVIGLGDSIGEAVQSADASARTQGASYHRLVARKLGVEYPLPWIRSGPFGVIGDTTLRSRYLPGLAGANLSVSGADVGSVLRDRADAASVAEIDSETDLVLFPRLGSQIEIVESARPDLAVCLIGANDALSAVLSFDELDASQLTPVADFAADFEELAQRLTAAAERTIFGNVPDPTRIGFLVDREDLIEFLGADQGLAAGDYSTIATMFLVQLGLLDPSVFQDPAFVLDAGEVALVQARVRAFNAIVQDVADSVGAPVADVHGLLESIHIDPPTVFGVELGTHFLGGFFSLDGVHPSNYGQLLLARLFLERLDEAYGLGTSSFGPGEQLAVFLRDPFIDKDGDGRVVGRAGAGLLETLAPQLGISGDPDDTDPGDVGPAFLGAPAGRLFLERYVALRGLDPARLASWSAGDSIEAMKDVFGLR